MSLGQKFHAFLFVILLAAFALVPLGPVNSSLYLLVPMSAALPNNWRAKRLQI